MDELEPIINHPRRKPFVKKEIHNWEDEGGSVHPEYIHPTEHDESDDLEDAKVIADEYRHLKKDMKK